MSAYAITGGPPPDDSFLRRLERMMKNGTLPDPQSKTGVIVYAVLGLAIGFWLGVAF
jgi:hypothetical protein